VFAKAWRRPVKSMDIGFGHFFSDREVFPCQRQLELNLLYCEEVCLEVDLVPSSLI